MQFLNFIQHFNVSNVISGSWTILKFFLEILELETKLRVLLLYLSSIFASHSLPLSPESLKIVLRRKLSNGSFLSPKRRSFQAFRADFGSILFEYMDGGCYSCTTMFGKEEFIPYRFCWGNTVFRWMESTCFEEDMPGLGFVFIRFSFRARVVENREMFMLTVNNLWNSNKDHVLSADDLRAASV